MDFEGSTSFHAHCMNALCPNSGKVQHASEEEADDALLEMKKRYPGYKGQPYFCLYCHTWHLGRSKPPGKKKRRS